MRERILIYGSMTIVLVGLIAFVAILRVIRPVNYCLRSHIEINNVPEHRVQDLVTLEWYIVPAERIETKVCDEWRQKDIYTKRYEKAEAQ